MAIFTSYGILNVQHVLNIFPQFACSGAKWWYPYSSGHFTGIEAILRLPRNLTIASSPMDQLWQMWVNSSHEFINLKPDNARKNIRDKLFICDMLLQIYECTFPHIHLIKTILNYWIRVVYYNKQGRVCKWHQSTRMMAGTVFCILLGVSSGCAWPITGQVTSVTWSVIGWA